MFLVWTVYASLSATPPTPLIPLPFTSNGRGTHRFVPTTVCQVYYFLRIICFFWRISHNCNLFLYLFFVLNLFPQPTTQQIFNNSHFIPLHIIPNASMKLNFIVTSLEGEMLHP
jgi:hypothetical protein